MLHIHKNKEQGNVVTVNVPLTEIDIDYIAKRVIELLDKREEENNKSENPSETPDKPNEDEKGNVFEFTDPSTGKTFKAEVVYASNDKK